MEAICTIDEADAIRTKLTVYKDYVEILKYWLGKNSCLHRNVAISYFCLVVTLMTFFFFYIDTQPNISYIFTHNFDYK